MRVSALLRALETIERHAEFVRWRAPLATSVDEPEVVFDLGVDLRPQWAADGTSPTGVRPVEAITVQFPVDYPNSPPVFRLRADFPRHLPHIQPDPLSLAPRPCLVHGSETNLFRRGGIEAMLAQLVYWLHAAAHDRLNDDPTVWQPARRDLVHDQVVLDLDQARELPKGRHTFAYQSATYTSLNKKGLPRLHRVLLGPESVQLTPKFWNGLKHAELGPAMHQGSSLAVILRPAPLPANAAFVADRYQPDAVHDIASLRVSLTDWRCNEAFDSFLAALNKELPQLEINASYPIPIALLVHVPRPRTVAGTTATTETMAYVIELPKGKGHVLAPNTPVRLAAVLEQTGPKLLQRFNQQDPARATRGWVAVGSGSLGSKIAILAAHQGRAPRFVVDPELQDPHNYARHALRPMSPEAPNSLMVAKVTAVSHEIACLQQPCEPWMSSVELAFSDPARLAKVHTLANWLLLNTTASVMVRNFLTREAHTLHLPRCAEGALFGAGRVGYLALAGPDHNPNPTELFALALQRFGERPSIAEAALSPSAQLDTIHTGLGCSSETMLVSDAAITQHAASMTTALMRLHEGDLPPTGTLWIGEQSDDSMSLTWTNEPVAPFIRVPVEVPPGGDSWMLHISSEVHARIESDVRAHPTTETGGILWGCVNEALGAILVVDVLDAPPDSERSVASFVLRTEGAKQAQQERFKRTHGALYCVGTWHSHLVPSGPSEQDREVARKIAEGGLHANALLIWTPAGYRALIADAMADPSLLPT
ncbi:JAB domain-containing protein similar to deubiquitination enzymes [Panacagrimonas perspica]|uniref:JAB domain-containing protein similar to deubiquitination enzymes n=1 Tax=Panacagrimonas perspica TaxID=381431 RepID=A0A4R7PFZ1_9GAMM|nr:Mov34/MPN/PAD-1 family protein [Panacagrimonas perspica]TDU32561.1 JAB domain-containing protein similar to deubiquitination enzymes [Panacagrimonas perspica]THD05461.1 hypothetical protein B1810_01675 [Panacagrimonas perspica]